MKNLNILMNCITETESEKMIIINSMIRHLNNEDYKLIILSSLGSYGKSLFREICKEVIPDFRIITSNELKNTDSNKDRLVISTEHNNKISDYGIDFERFKLLSI